MRVPRSLLFVPASRPDFLAKAAASGADVVILDIEDAVAPADKERARRDLPDHAGRLAAGGTTVWVRTESLAEGGAEDIDLAVACGARTVLLPKIDRPALIGEAVACLEAAEAKHGGAGGAASLVALIESAAGVIAAAEIARADRRMSGLAFGGEDFAADLMVPPSGLALTLPAGSLVIAARAAGLPAFGLPGSLAEFRDLAAFAATVEHAAAIGFSGALAIHPAQVPIINAAFTPGAAETDWAKRVLAAAESAGTGSFALDGRMIDKPIVKRARRILDRSG